MDGCEQPAALRTTLQPKRSQKSIVRELEFEDDFLRLSAAIFLGCLAPPFRPPEILADQAHVTNRVAYRSNLTLLIFVNRPDRHRFDTKSMPGH
jgi:hypothetical protein